MLPHKISGLMFVDGNFMFGSINLPCIADMQHRSWAYLAEIDNCTCYYDVIDITLLQVEWFGVGQVCSSLETS